MGYFSIKKLDGTTYYIKEKLGVGCYLFLGENGALLSDTGNGYGDLRRVVDKIVGGKPLTVMNTHGHADHAGGNDQFGRVYIHANDLHMLEGEWQRSQREKLTVYIKKNYPVLTPLVWFLTRKRYTPIATKPDVLGNGHVFDLGGRQIETIHVPGHSPGSVVLLDRQTKALYAGDAVNPGLFLFFAESPTPKEYAKVLRGLTQLSGYEKLRISHGDITLPFDFIAYYADFLERATLEKSKLTPIPNERPVYKYSEPAGKYPAKEIAVNFTKQEL